MKSRCVNTFSGVQRCCVGPLIIDALKDVNLSLLWSKRESRVKDQIKNARHLAIQFLLFPIRQARFCE